MPELPEVETIASGLRPALCGRCIVAVTVRNAGTLEGPRATPALFADAITGRRICGVGRRGKLLLVAFSHVMREDGDGAEVPAPDRYGTDVGDAKGMGPAALPSMPVRQGPDARTHASPLTLPMVGPASVIVAPPPIASDALADGAPRTLPDSFSGNFSGNVYGNLCGTAPDRSPGTTEGGMPRGAHPPRPVIAARPASPVSSADMVRHLRAGDATGVTGLAFHLKMTGRLFIHPEGTSPGLHTRVIFDLDDGHRLFFDDARKFGYVRAVSPQSLETWAFWRSLGPEPLETGPESFVALFAGRRGRIKAMLLDQKVLAGVGNIYADESLFRAGIRPDATVDTVSRARLAALHGHLQDVLRESIAECGSSIRDYRDAHGDAGAFQNRFRVYGRGGEACVTCGGRLESIQVAGRTTVLCPRCQK